MRDLNVNGDFFPQYLVDENSDIAIEEALKGKEGCRM